MNCKIKEQQGHILPIMLFLLSCTMLWSSLFLLALSDQQAASNTCIRQEQSRLLAYSGWNLALQQLENSGGLEPILLENPAGQLQVQLEQLSSGLVAVQSEAISGESRNLVQGTVRLFSLPWNEIDTWPMVTEWPQMDNALLLTDQQQIQLDYTAEQSLAISQMDGLPLLVCVEQPVTLKKLYVHGDLEVNSPLKADEIYVSGQISGLEQIACPQTEAHYATEPGYRIQVETRAL